MLLKFGNGSPEHAGNPIYIDTDWITAVHPMNSPSGGGLITVIFGGPTGVTWIVEEGVEEVVKRVNVAKGASKL
jgi:hypothetical protein